MTTVDNICASLTTKYGASVNFVGLDDDATGDVYKEAVADAVTAVGGSLVVLDDLTDSNLAGLVDAQILLHSELSLVEILLGNFVAVDMSVGGRSQSFNQLRTWLEGKRTSLKTDINNRYGSAGAPTFDMGRLVNYDSEELYPYGYDLFDELS